MLSIKTLYNKDGKVVDNDRAKLPIGSAVGQFLPYDMLFGALASCLYYTFSDVIEKKRLIVDEVEIRVTGEKREEVPTTLAWVKIQVDIKSDADVNQLEKSVDLACKYCSIHETIKQVAEITHEVRVNK